MPICLNLSKSLYIILSKIIEVTILNKIIYNQKKINQIKKVFEKVNKLKNCY